MEKGNMEKRAVVWAAVSRTDQADEDKASLPEQLEIGRAAAGAVTAAEDQQGSSVTRRSFFGVGG